MAGGCLGIGLLLWARLILVSDMPRMALAEPEETAPVPAEQATDASAAGDDREGETASDPRGADAATQGGTARPDDAESARPGQNFPDPHNPDSFTPEPPKSQRNRSD